MSDGAGTRYFGIASALQTPCHSPTKTMKTSTGGPFAPNHPTMRDGSRRGARAGVGVGAERRSSTVVDSLLLLARVGCAAQERYHVADDPGVLWIGAQ